MPTSYYGEAEIIPYGCRPLFEGEIVLVEDVFYSMHDGRLCTALDGSNLGNPWRGEWGTVQYYRKAFTPRGNKFVSLEL